MKNKKGISLIVLVITIIVMIILAAAIILSLNNSGIIGNANKAVDESNLDVIKSEADLKYAEYLLRKDIIGNATLEEWLNNEVKHEGYYIKMYDGEATVIKEGSLADKFYKGEIKIGDYIKYDPTEGVTNVNGVSYTSLKAKNGYAEQVFTLEGSYNSNVYGWQVMGIGKDGGLLLLSEDYIQPISGGYTYNEKEFFGLSGKLNGEINKTRKVYLDIVGELNNICNLFGKGYGASGARCVTIEDIDKVTGYNPEAAGNIPGKVFRAGEVRAYQNIVTYYWENVKGEIKVYYEGTNGAKGYLTENHETFEWYEGTTYHKENKPTNLSEGKKQKITTIKSNYYLYYPETLTNNKSDAAVGNVKSGTLAYDLLFVDESDTDTYTHYWLASTFTYSSLDYINFGMRYVRAGGTRGWIAFGSNGEDFENYRGIRAVVALKPEIKLSLTGTKTVGTEIANIYEITK